MRMCVTMNMASGIGRAERVRAVWRVLDRHEERSWVHRSRCRCCNRAELRARTSAVKRAGVRPFHTAPSFPGPSRSNKVRASPRRVAIRQKEGGSRSKAREEWSVRFGRTRTLAFAVASLPAECPLSANSGHPIQTHRGPVCACRTASLRGSARPRFALNPRPDSGGPGVGDPNVVRRASRNSSPVQRGLISAHQSVVRRNCLRDVMRAPRSD